MGEGGVRQRPAYMPGLDGLRAVSVVAVFLFHADLLQGGFVGVEVFFVISGFLITGLAVSEIESNGRLALGRFWARRARRLLPALFALCAACVAYLLIVSSGSVERLRSDLVATLLYVSNWSQISGGSDYFAHYTDRSPLDHTWSLAIEEQFYVVWPLMLVALAAIVGARSKRLRPVVISAAATVAVVSIGWSMLLAVGGADTSRLYYGTDTRLGGIALGAIAACLVLRPGRTTTTDRKHTVVAVASSGALLVLALVIDGSERWLYGPGFLLIAVASIGLILAATGSGPVAALLSLGPLVAIGRVSYGIYLWHLPVIVVLSETRTGLSGPTLVALWISATALLTAASWFLVERRAPLPTVARPSLIGAYVAVGLVTLAGAVVVADRVDRPTIDADDLLAVAAVPVARPPVTSPVSMTVEPVEAVAHLDQSRSLRTAASTTTTSPPAPPPPRPLPVDRPLRVLMLGDSVAWTLDAPGDVVSIERVGAVEIVNRGVLACPVDPSGSWIFDGEIVADPVVCEGTDRFGAAVDETDPDLIVTLFGWPGINDRVLDDGSIVRPCQPTFDAKWGQRYGELVDRLSLAAPVVVSTIAYYRGGLYDVPDARTDCLNAVLAEREFSFFELAGWLCPDGDCADLAALRPDGVHFDVDGELAHAVWSRIVIDSAIAAGFDVP